MDEYKAKQLYLLIRERLLKYYYLKLLYDLLYLACNDATSSK